MTSLFSLKQLSRQSRAIHWRRPSAYNLALEPPFCLCPLGFSALVAMNAIVWGVGVLSSYIYLGPVYIQTHVFIVSYSVTAQVRYAFTATIVLIHNVHVL
jgi:hypothetical protein